jgi:fructosamine-3-kinase
MQARRINGGDISNSFQLISNAGDFFLKYSEDTSRKDFYKKEYHGLMRLINSKTLSVPQPLFYGSTTNESFLVTAFIQKTSPQQNFWRIFAEKLAALHRCTYTHFGLEEDNYIGSLPQHNQLKEKWADFYAYCRLEPFVKRCVDQQLLPPAIIKYSEHLYSRLPEIFPEERPALLHGDLWGGNYLSGPGGVPFVFDPAVYYGSREMDLAMTRLFGGFDRRFYWYYEDYFPLAQGWQERISVCQLYPLLVHALLFGGGYIQQVRKILSDF